MRIILPTAPKQIAQWLLTALLTGVTVPAALAQSPIVITAREGASTDDAEENKSGGAIDLTSSDLELVQDGGKNQWVGMRFRDVALPPRAVITRAYIQFTVDEAQSNSTSVTLYGQAADNPAAFAATTANISARPRTAATVAWNNIPAWNTLGAAGNDQRTPDLKAIVQEIVNRPGWASGNALVMMLDGNGHRTANSYDLSANGAPQLVVEYAPAGTFPVAQGSIWRYNDQGQDLGMGWRTPTFDDSNWSSDRGALGYGDQVTTTLNFGPNANSKYATYYFRHTFDVANAARFDSLLFELRRDDGAVVYLNGQELFRQNMPAGPVSYTTLASTPVSGTNETAYFRQAVAASSLITGRNVLAVEVHQATLNSSDISFDLSVRGKESSLLGCNGPNDQHFSCFTSVEPGAQIPGLVLPSTHTFQVLLRQGQRYTNTRVRPNVPGNNDFTAYVPRDGSSTLGYLSVNHENTPGGVSLLDVRFDEERKLWVVDSSQAVSFYNNSLVTTSRNCSGGITPWGTVITSEETTVAGDANNDGYQDEGWNVEIDPATRRVKEYGNGKPEKLWALGRMNHENVVVSPDQRTAYEGEDAPSGCVYKFVANTAGNLSAGLLYVLKLDNGLVGGAPTTPTATWVQVPNTTQADRNTTTALAAALGGTIFNGVEDVDIAADGRVYFTSKGNSRTYRFRDNGAAVTEFEVYVGGSRNYAINHGSGTTSEPWGIGNDNLTFDDRGNLFVLQDGSRNHIWMVRPGHTQANPQVELFFRTPAGGEPTGLTFSPDHKYAFMSIQRPSASNASSYQIDAAGDTVRFDRAMTIVIARKEFLGNNASAAKTALSASKGGVGSRGSGLNVFPNPARGQRFTASFRTEGRAQVRVELLDLMGRRVATLADGRHERGEFNYSFDASRTGRALHGVYVLRLTVNGRMETRKVAFE